MSEAIAFDTHRFVKRLTQTGFTETQAEALADEQVHLLNSNLATRQNLAELKAELQQEMTKLEGKLKQEMTELEGRLKQQMTELEGRLKEQIIQVKGDLERQMAELEGRLKQQMAEHKADLLKWMIGAMIAQTGVIVGLMFGFMKLFMGA